MLRKIRVSIPTIPMDDGAKESGGPGKVIYGLKNGGGFMSPDFH